MMVGVSEERVLLIVINLCSSKSTRVNKASNFNVLRTFLVKLKREKSYKLTKVS